MGDAGVLHLSNFLKLKEKVLLILAVMNCAAQGLFANVDHKAVRIVCLLR